MAVPYIPEKLFWSRYEHEIENPNATFKKKRYKSFADVIGLFTLKGNLFDTSCNTIMHCVDKTAWTHSVESQIMQKWPACFKDVQEAFKNQENPVGTCVITCVGINKYVASLIVSDNVNIETQTKTIHRKPVSYENLHKAFEDFKDQVIRLKLPNNFAIPEDMSCHSCRWKITTVMNNLNEVFNMHEWHIEIRKEVFLDETFKKLGLLS